MGVIWDQAEKRTFRSREEAAAFKSFLLTHAEIQRRKDGKGVKHTIEEIMRKSAEFAAAATLESISESGHELDRHRVRDVPDSEVAQRAEAGDGEMAGYRSGGVRALEAEASDFDRLVYRLESGEGEG